MNGPGQKTYNVAVIREGGERLEGQYVHATARPIQVGDAVQWPLVFEPGVPPVPFEVIEIRESTDHSEPVILLRPPSEA